MRLQHATSDTEVQNTTPERDYRTILQNATPQLHEVDPRIAGASKRSGEAAGRFHLL